MKDSTRRGLMIAQGVAMVVVGLVLLYLRAAMTLSLFTLLGCILSVLLIAGSLLFIAITDVLSSVGLDSRHAPHLRRILIGSAIAAAAGAVVILVGPMTIRTACCLFAVYSLVLCIAKVHLARHWVGTRQARAVIRVLAGIALLFSGLLAAVAILAEDDREVLVAIAVYAVFMGFQMLLTLYSISGKAAATTGMQPSL
ncbi:MAG: hypothetical protein WBD46_06615 [Acidobacteriaceae bacterium]